MHIRWALVIWKSAQEAIQIALAARVLLIEDHPDLVDLYQLKLQLEGYRVAVARTGNAGLAMATSLVPDVILLDLNLPEIEGIELMARLRAKETTSSIPVVVLTEDDSPERMEAAGRLGVAAYMIKSRTLPKRMAEAVAAALDQPKLEAGTSKAS